MYLNAAECAQPCLVVQVIDNMIDNVFWYLVIVFVLVLSLSLLVAWG